MGLSHNDFRRAQDNARGLPRSSSVSSASSSSVFSDSARNAPRNDPAPALQVAQNAPKNDPAKVPQADDYQEVRPYDWARQPTYFKDISSDIILHQCAYCTDRTPLVLPVGRCPETTRLSNDRLTPFLLKGIIHGLQGEVDRYRMFPESFIPDRSDPLLDRAIKGAQAAFHRAIAALSHSDITNESLTIYQAFSLLMFHVAGEADAIICGEPQFFKRISCVIHIMQIIRNASWTRFEMTLDQLNVDSARKLTKSVCREISEHISARLRDHGVTNYLGDIFLPPTFT